MMYRCLGVISMLLALLLAGCGGSGAPPLPATAVDGPHNGVIVPLPGGAGFAEILNEGTESSTARGKGRSAMMVVVYFLGPDKTTALTNAPTNVSIKLAGESAGAPISLTPSPDTKDPAGASRFASSPGDFELSGRRAELSGELGGQKFTQEFQGLR